MNRTEARNYQTTVPQRPRRYDQDQSAKKLIKVKSRSITRGEQLLFSVFFICLTLASVYMVSYNSNIDSLNRDLQRLDHEISEQQSINENLSHQVMEYSNPERILMIAKKNGLDIQNTQVKQATSVVE